MARAVEPAAILATAGKGSEGIAGGGEPVAPLPGTGGGTGSGSGRGSEGIAGGVETVAALPTTGSGTGSVGGRGRGSEGIAGGVETVAALPTTGSGSGNGRGSEGIAGGGEPVAALPTTGSFTGSGNGSGNGSGKGSEGSAGASKPVAPGAVAATELTTGPSAPTVGIGDGSTLLIAGRDEIPVTPPPGTLRGGPARREGSAGCPGRTRWRARMVRRRFAPRIPRARRTGRLSLPPTPTRPRRGGTPG